VNVGSNTSPDYRLSIVSNNLAADTIQLSVGTNNLLTTLSTGAAATYQVDGLSTPIQSNSRQVTLSPGLTVNMLQTNVGKWDTITVAPNTNSLSSGLSNFVTAYNAAVDGVNQQHGQNAGPLAGSSLITSLGQALQSVSLYSSSSGSVSSLADLGLSLDATSGHLSFDPTQLSNLNPAAIQQFLGSSTSGFLAAAGNAMTSVADSSSGLIQSNVTQVQTEITNENTLIAQQQNQINTVQTNMEQQLSAADAAIAVLQQQVTMMSELFQAQYGSTSNNSTGGSSAPGA
jgi:flagellar hook-associated protein 2